MPGCLALHLAGHLPQLMLPALHLASLPFSAPAGSSSELSSSEAAPWLPRCAPTVHAERFIICELTMSPCRVERTEEAESGCAGQWVERETHGRASIEHHCTDDRHQPVLARPSPANTAPQIWPPCRSLAAEPAQPLELVGRWCRRCTVGFSSLLEVPSSGNSLR